MNNIAIFASGSGSNAENIIRFFRPHPDIGVKLILTNNPDARVIQRAREHEVEHFVFSRSDFREASIVLDKLLEKGIDFIVLAGFLWLVPLPIIRAFPGKIVNIHPALLPAYGGKGMYGDHVHRAVITNREKESGITIHYVNEKYDEGQIIFQAACPVLPGDTPAALAGRIHELEYAHYPRIIQEIIEKPLPG